MFNKPIQSLFLIVQLFFLGKSNNIFAMEMEAHADIPSKVPTLLNLSAAVIAKKLIQENPAITAITEEDFYARYRTRISDIFIGEIYDKLQTVSVKIINNTDFAVIKADLLSFEKMPSPRKLELDSFLFPLNFNSCARIINPHELVLLQENRRIVFLRITYCALSHRNVLVPIGELKYQIRGFNVPVVVEGARGGPKTSMRPYIKWPIKLQNRFPFDIRVRIQPFPTEQPPYYLTINNQKVVTIKGNEVLDSFIYIPLITYDPVASVQAWYWPHNVEWTGAKLEIFIGEQNHALPLDVPKILDGFRTTTYMINGVFEGSPEKPIIKSISADLQK